MASEEADGSFGSTERHLDLMYNAGRVKAGAEKGVGPRGGKGFIPASGGVHISKKKLVLFLLIPFLPPK